MTILCQCTVSYHVEQRADGRFVCVLDDDESIPDVMTMLTCNCEKCGLPYHNEKLGQPFD